MPLNLNKLNPQQKEAVLLTEGPVLIIAGAGTGKTQCLTYRLTHLIETGIKPENILALTFTNKAAEEMASRVKNLLKGTKINAEDLFAGTFHSFGAKILRQELKNSKSPAKKELGRSFLFAIFDDDDSLSLIRKIIKGLELDSRQFNSSIIKEKISGLKAELFGPDEYETRVSNFFEKIILKVYRKYEEELKKNNAFDFDDLIEKPVLIFKKYGEILENYQNQYRYILIDEYQDTNRAQYELTKLLASKFKNLCVVGDDQQSIYAWRKADFRNILNFEKDFPEAKVVILEENYRSSQNILNAANAIIKNNIHQKKKYLWTKNPKGWPLCVIETHNEKEEAYFVAEKIADASKEESLLFKDFSVLYRINAQSRSLEEALIKFNIPYQIIGGIKFYERREIKDILAILRIAQNPEDSAAKERIKKTPALKKNLPVTIKECKNIIENAANSPKLPLSELIKLVIKKLDYESYLNEKFEDADRRIENIYELASLAKNFDLPPRQSLNNSSQDNNLNNNIPKNNDWRRGDFNLEEGLSRFLETVSLYQEADNFNEKKNAVSLMTVHAAKGLEFNTVFVAGLEEGLFPHSKSLTPRDLEEERRLAYVAITRAKNKIYLSYAGRRLIFGSFVQNCKSRFLDEIPKELIEEINPFSEKNIGFDEYLKEEDEWIEY